MSQLRHLTQISICFTLILGAFTCSSGQEFDEHLISRYFDGARDVCAVDLDDDGDIDAIGAGYDADQIAWWENDGDEDFTVHLIQTDYDGAIRVHALDIDGDDDIDVLGAAYRVGQVHWWENDGDQHFTQHTITNEFYRPRSIFAADLDSDDDIDILATADTDGELFWWENEGDENFRARIIDGNISYPYCVTASDIDDDGDLDVLAVANLANDIVWYENDGDGEFDENVIDNNFMGIREALAFDLDRDGDKDIIASSWTLNELRWWENDGDEDFRERLISDDCEDVQSFAVGDLDEDHDIDIVSASPEGDIVFWWENIGEEDFDRHVVDDTFDHAASVFIADVDLDSDLDILGTAYNDDEVVWWENLVDYHLPSTFDLASPLDSTIITDDPQMFTWQQSNDVDPGDRIRYEVWIYPDSTLADGFIAADSILTAEVEITDLEENYAEYYWRVRAADNNSIGTRSNQVFHFATNYIPEPPVPFFLLEPGDGTEYTPDNISDIQTLWQSSADPDTNEYVTYRVSFSIISEGIDDTLMKYAGITDTLLNINLIDSLDLIYWENMLEVTWWVEAISDSDTVSCEEMFQFTIERNSSVPSDLDILIPDKWAIHSVYPNPFNPDVNIQIALPEPDHLDLRIYNIHGQQVGILASGLYEAGIRYFAFEGTGHASGVYFIHAFVPGKLDQISKVLMVR
ncbi:MAG: FG-GAP-like repeat-containing protein [Candidatus Electryonea clarkiae]|nr:FG-GAP-like repeat-containing protein [Candidatus Electryonea clarkiae]MDP8287729.1 FG-GAP-like repeat-containing protein [Candidatus Electryonea clarkiae]